MVKGIKYHNQVVPVVQVQSVLMLAMDLDHEIMQVLLPDHEGGKNLALYLPNREDLETPKLPIDHDHQNLALVLELKLLLLVNSYLHEEQLSHWVSIW